MNLIELVGEAGLTGRGGGAFPTATKIGAAIAGDAGLIINACDGEVGAAKDAWVLHHHLREVIAAATRLVRDDFAIAAHRDSRALAIAQAAGVRTLDVPRRYVSSEESALVSLFHGGLARPLARTQPITAGSRTPGGRELSPTLVLNAETLWRVDQISRRGAKWFRSFGTTTEPGPRLVTIGGRVARPGVYESAAGVPLEQLLALAGGTSSGSDSLWLNGISGGFVPLPAGYATPWSGRGLQRFGLRIGAGIIRAMDDSAAGPWPAILAATRYAAAESAGQCGPCMFGLPAVADDVELISTGIAATSDWDRLLRRLQQLPDRGSCRYPDGVAGFLNSALQVHGWRLRHPANPYSAVHDGAA